MDENKYTHTCKRCGKVLKGVERYRFYCAHCSQIMKAASKKSSREFTELTPYLVQKYLLEGMSKKDIADLLDRCVEDVEKASAVKLRKFEYQTMREYLNPVKVVPKTQNEIEVKKIWGDFKSRLAINT